MKSAVLKRAKGFVPILDWLPRYIIKDNLLKDIIGGLTVGIMHIPQGVFAVVSLIAGSCNIRVTEELFSKNGSFYENVDKDYISINVSTSLCLLSGLIGIIMAMLRFDFMLAFLSDHVIKGFTTGAAFHVFVAQLNKILGVKLPRKSGPGKLFLMLHDVTESAVQGLVNYYTLGISVFTIVVLYSSKNFLNSVIKKKIKTIPVPYDLMVMIIGVVLSSIFKLSANFGVKIIGFIPTGLPAPKVPDVTLFSYMFYDAVSVALVAMVVTISMGKLFAKKHNYKIDDRQEFYALGLCGALGSFFPIWPPSTALARTLVYEAAGTKTQLATIFSCGLLLSVMLFLGPFLEALPVCLLSCIIIVALKEMFMQMTEIPRLWKVSRLDAFCFIVTTAATVGFDVVEGLLAGVLFSFAAVIYKTQKSSVKILEEKFEGKKGSVGLRLKIDGSLFYMNLEKIKKELDIILDESLSPRIRSKSQSSVHSQLLPLYDQKLLTIDMSTVNFIDSSGISMLLELIAEQEKHSLKIRFQNYSDSTRETIERHSSKDKFFTN